MLAEIVESVRANPGLRNKGPIALVADVLGEAGHGPTDWQSGPGDDGAVVEAHGLPLIVGGEALWPPFVAADPYGAGIAAVLANVNDLAAMGARPLAIVDTLVGSEETARRALEGMAHAGRLYDVPLVGGHLTITDGPPALSAFGLGQAEPGCVLSIARAAPGQSLMLAACTEGEMRVDFPFFRSFAERGGELAGDVRTLHTVAADGHAMAAKDVSMAGLLGSLAMLLECNRLGTTVDLDILPAPKAVPLPAWLNCFPCFAFWLCVHPGREAACAQAFERRGLTATVVGTLDDTGLLRARLGPATATVFDLTHEAITGLPPR